MSSLLTSTGQMFYLVTMLMIIGLLSRTSYWIPKVNLFPFNLLSQTINHHSSRRVFIKKLTKKQAAFKQYLSTKSHSDLRSYQLQRNKTKQVIRKAKIDHESSIISELKSNPKRLHKYIRQKQKVKHSIGMIKNPDGSTTTTNEESAEALASFFKSVFILEDLQELPNFSRRVDEDIPNFVITEELVYHKLSKLNTTKAQGPDEIHPYILASFCERLCKPLCLIYNQSLQSGQLPKDWKLANVTPVFKNGQRNLPNNFCPISLTSQACKVLESIIRDQMIDFLSGKNIFPSNNMDSLTGNPVSPTYLKHLKIGQHLLT